MEPNGGQRFYGIKPALEVLCEAIVCHDNFESHWDKFGDIKRCRMGRWGPFFFLIKPRTAVQLCTPVRSPRSPDFNL